MCQIEPQNAHLVCTAVHTSFFMWTNMGQLQNVQWKGILLQLIRACRLQALHI